MKHRSKVILDFVFQQSGQDPPDDVLALWGDACHVAFLSLLSSMADNNKREAAMKKIDADTADCIRRMSEALEAIEDGDLEAERPN